jgi:hypothetical protein
VSEGFSDDEVRAAVEALGDPERFARAEAIVAAAAPQLQSVLAQALESGGWFGEAHEGEVRKASELDDPEQRVAALRTLLAEEARMGMMVGVAVGWALAEELNRDDEEELE